MAQTKLNLRTSIKTSAVVWVIGLGTASLFAAAVIKNQKATPSDNRITIANSSLMPVAGTTFKADDMEQNLFAFSIGTQTKSKLIQITKFKIIATTQNGKAKQSIEAIKNLQLYLRDSSGESKIETEFSAGKVTSNSYELIFSNPQTTTKQGTTKATTAFALGIASYIDKNVDVILKGDFPDSGIVSDSVTFSMDAKGVGATAKTTKSSVSGSVKGALLILDGGVKDPSTCDSYSDDDAYCPAGYDCTLKTVTLKDPFNNTTSNQAQGSILVNGESSIAAQAGENISVVLSAIDPSEVPKKSTGSKTTCTSAEVCTTKYSYASDDPGMMNFYKLSWATSNGKSATRDCFLKANGGKKEFNKSCNAKCETAPWECADSCWRYKYEYVPSCSIPKDGNGSSIVSFGNPGVYTITGQATMTKQYSEPDDSSDFATVKVASTQVEIYSDPPTGKLTASSAKITNGSPLTLTATLNDDFGFRKDKIIPQYKSDSFGGTLDCGWKNIPGFTAQSCKSGKTACTLAWTGNATLGTPGTYTMRVAFGDTDNTPHYETAETAITVK